MTTQEWALIAARMITYWPATKWEPETIAIWGEELQGFDVEAVRTAFNTLKLRPGAFAPSLGDVLSEIRADPSQPTFEEMFRIWEKAASVRVPARRYDDDGHRWQVKLAAIREVLAGEHPVAASFIERYGIRRMYETGWHDPEDGKWRRKELVVAWAAHVEAMDGREVAMLAGPRGSGELAQLDPLRGLGLRRPEVPALPAGDG